MGQLQVYIVVFGVGYVGCVLVFLFVSLFCWVCWIDLWEYEFFVILFDGVEKVVNDEVFDEVEWMLFGSYFIVMIYNYLLDLEFIVVILVCNDFVYFGLIGLKIKCVKFEYCLCECGVDVECL